MRQVIGLLGTPVDVVTIEQAVSRMEAFIAAGRFHHVATANTDFLVNAVNDAELRTILRDAALVLPDGMPLVWASRMPGFRLPERVTGADIVPLLFDAASRRNYRIYMLGATQAVATRARARLEEQYPGVAIVGCESPGPDRIEESESTAILDRINRARPDILLVAFGNPKQEKWIYNHRDRLKSVPLCVGVGATFDFLSGAVLRAPLFMQRLGLEWLHRLAHDPVRLWRRYARDMFQGGRMLVRQYYMLARQRRSGAFKVALSICREAAVIELCGDFGKENIPEWSACVATALNTPGNLTINMRRVVSLDTAGLGALLEVARLAAMDGKQLLFDKAPPEIARVMRACQMELDISVQSSEHRSSSHSPIFQESRSLPPTVVR